MPCRLLGLLKNPHGMEPSPCSGLVKTEPIPKSSEYPS